MSAAQHAPAGVTIEKRLPYCTDTMNAYRAYKRGADGRTAWVEWMETKEIENDSPAQLRVRVYQLARLDKILTTPVITGGSSASFDEQPDGDPHGECAAEIARLTQQRDQCVAALRGVIRVADRKTAEFDAARAAIVAAGGTS